MNKNDAFYLEDQFIESPIFDNWFKKHYPQKSLLICSPYIKKNAVDRVINLYKLNKRGKDFDLRVLIRGNTEEFTARKSSDISALDSLINLDCADASKLRRVQNLHMKAYLVDDAYLLITSGNLTNSGMFVVSGKENFEGGISTRSPQITLAFLNYFRSIWQQSQELNSFYDELVEAYAAYIENEYSEQKTLKRLNRKKYKFPSKSSSEMPAPPAAEPSLYPSFGQILDSSLPEAADDNGEGLQTFTLDDIPPVGSLEHIPEVLRIVNAHPEGISYLELGKLLRSRFGDGISNTNGANRKFGEEKGKFAAFLGLVSIIDSSRGKLITSNKLSVAYASMSRENREKMIKDIFFDKPLIVSIMRKSLETQDFNLLQFLLDNCEARRTTLSRKVGPLKELFSHISAICTEEELQSALKRV